MRMQRRKRSRSEGESETFDACLSRLIEVKHSSARALAETLEIDVSLVHKWLRGERIPRFGSHHVERIGEALGLNAAERAELELSHTSTLCAAQTRSLTNGQPKKSVPKRIASLMARIVSHPVESVIPETTSSRGKQTPPLPKDGVIPECQAMQQTVVDFIGGVPRTRKADRTLLMTFHSEGISEGGGAHGADSGTRWQQAVRDALRRGWRVEHVWRLTRDVRRTAFLVATTLDLLSAGDYQPLYTSSADTPSTPYDLVIRPDAALLLLAAHNTRNVDGGILTRDPKQIKLLSAHFAQLRAQAKPLLHSFLRDDPRFGRVLVDSETRFPGRSLVKYGLSFFTEPEEWSCPDSSWARRMSYPERDTTTFCEHRRLRLEAFRANIGAHLYRDICPKRAVERLAQEGRYARYTEQHASARQLDEVASPDERRAHLRSAIEVLKAHEHFQLALVDADEEEVLQMRLGTYWEVAGASRVLINSRTLDASGQPVDLMIVIDEPTIVAGCAAHFDQLWERIKPRNRDKEYVVWWLERQLEALQA